MKIGSIEQMISEMPHKEVAAVQAIQNREEHGNRHFVEKNEIKYCIEIKYSPIQDNAVRQIHTIAKECNAEAILVTIYELELDHVLA